MDPKWEVDEANTVTAHFGAFGKKVISVNGSEVYNSRKFTRNGEIDFSLRSIFSPTENRKFR